MADRSAIEWTDATWNPIRARGALGRHYCLKISPGCEHCYASTMTRRLGGFGYREETSASRAGARGLVDEGRIHLDETVLIQPLRWRKPRRVFVCSMTDLFGEWVPDEWILEIWLAMLTASHHTFQVLTKRPGRMADWLSRLPQLSPGFGPETWPLPNVWLGTSIESDAYAWRAKELSKIPAAVRFVSAEPLLGPLPSVFHAYHWARGAVSDHYRPPLDWLIVGGESGGPPERRLVDRCTWRVDGIYRHGVPRGYPEHCPDDCAGTGWAPKPKALDWVRDLRDRALRAGVAFHFKQWGGPSHGSGGRFLDGRTWDEFPQPEPERAEVMA